MKNLKVRLKNGQTRTGFEEGEEVEWPYTASPNPYLFEIIEPEEKAPEKETTKKKTKKPIEEKKKKAEAKSKAGGVKKRTEKKG